MTFLQAEKKRQTEWKLKTKYLSREAKKPGLYCSRLFPFCLPIEHSEENLFPPIRDEALTYFRLNDISWHGSALPGKPSNHLCSSQILTVNLLFPFQHDPEALKALFSPIIPDIEEILPIEKDGQYLAFEWIHPKNPLGETPHHGRVLRRGLGNTSIDFAFLYRSTTGGIHFVLGETKYTESYAATRGGIRSDGMEKVSLYKPFFIGEDSPFKIKDIPSIEEFSTEPFYQLLRHQLLAAQTVNISEGRISRAIVLHLYTEQNKALQRPTNPAFRIWGDSVYPIWKGLLNTSEDFVYSSLESMISSFCTVSGNQYRGWTDVGAQIELTD
jgi:hypothetical protein